MTQSSSLSKQQLSELIRYLDGAEQQILSARQLLAGLGIVGSETLSPSRTGITGGQIIEGFFDGEAMIDAEGKRYNVPANYASKSKLVEGDKLKLTILSDGTFVFKQIGPVDRRNERGVVVRDGQSFRIAVGERLYHLLHASITFHKLAAGDQVAVIIPDTREARFATLEAVIERQVEAGEV